jgi:hypothetical protein
MQHHLRILFWKLPQETLDAKNCFPVENIQVIAEEELVNHFLQLEQYMFRVTSSGFRSLTFKVTIFLTHSVKTEIAGNK